MCAHVSAESVIVYGDKVVKGIRHIVHHKSYLTEHNPSTFCLGMATEYTPIVDTSTFGGNISNETTVNSCNRQGLFYKYISKQSYILGFSQHLFVV